MSKKKIHIILWCSEIRITYACKPNRRGRLYYFFCTKVEVNYRVGLRQNLLALEGANGSISNLIGYILSISPPKYVAIFHPLESR